MIGNDNYRLVNAIIDSKLFGSKDIEHYVKSLQHGKISYDDFINKVGFSKEKVVDSMRKYIEDYEAINLKSEAAWEAARQLLCKFKHLKNKDSSRFNILYFKNNAPFVELTIDYGNQLSYSRVYERDFKSVTVGKHTFIVGKNNYNDNIVTILSDNEIIDAMINMSDEYDIFWKKWSPLKSSCAALLQIPVSNYSIDSAAVDVYYSTRDVRVYVLTGYADGLSIILNHNNAEIIRTSRICHEI